MNITLWHRTKYCLKNNYPQVGEEFGLRLWAKVPEIPDEPAENKTKPENTSNASFHCDTHDSVS